MGISSRSLQVKVQDPLRAWAVGAPIRASAELLPKVPGPALTPLHSAPICRNDQLSGKTKDAGSPLITARHPRPLDTPMLKPSPPNPAADWEPLQTTAAHTWVEGAERKLDQALWCQFESPEGHSNSATL